MTVKNSSYDVIIIGSGPGGVGAAIGAKKAGAQNVLVIERDVELGGILKNIYAVTLHASSGLYVVFAKSIFYGNNILGSQYL